MIIMEKTKMQQRGFEELKHNFSEMSLDQQNRMMYTWKNAKLITNHEFQQLVLVHLHKKNAKSQQHDVAYYSVNY
jgi:hypothetical protein